MATKVKLRKSEPVLMRQVQRYVRRYGGRAEDAQELILLGRVSGPKAPERKLADAFRKAGMDQVCIQLALEGQWSDFKSPLLYPKKALVEMLAVRELNELCERVKAGEFDG